MAPDLLSTICNEIDERLSELRPLLAEYERLLVAASALVATGRPGGSVSASEAPAPVKRARRGAQGRPASGRRGAGVTEPPASGSFSLTANEPAGNESAKSLDTTDASRRASTRSSFASKPKASRAVRGAAREAILAALDHGSHTVGELIVVTAMTGPNINGNLRRLISEGTVIKTEREGKTAWALAGSAA